MRDGRKNVRLVGETDLFKKTPDLHERHYSGVHL